MTFDEIIEFQKDLKKLTKRYKSLKTRGVNSGLRLIYAYFKNDFRIVFIELYHKNDKAGENRERILKYFK